MTTFPVSSPFTSGTVVTKAQLDTLVSAVNALAPLRVFATAVGAGGFISSSDTALTSAFATWTEQIDELGAFNPATGQTTIPAGFAGRYEISAQVSINGTNAQQEFVSCGVVVNGATVRRNRTAGPNAAALGDYFDANLPAFPVDLSSGDVVELAAATGPTASVLSSHSTYLYLRRVWS